MNSVTIKIVGFIVSVFIILTVISQVVILFKGSTEVEKATFVSVSDSVSFKGIFVRNEKVLSQSANGVVHYLYSDGSKIAKNSVIAETYSSEKEITQRQQIKEIDKELANLNRVVNPATKDIAQPEFLSKQIDGKYQELQYYIVKKDYDKIKDIKSEISVLMNIHNLVTKVEDESVFEERIDSLESLKAQLNMKLSQPLDVINSDSPGYFVSYTDGYEDVLNVENIDELSAEEIQKITESNIVKSTENIGKVIDSYYTKIIGIVDLSSNYIKSTDISIKIVGDSSLIPVKLDSLTPIENTDKSVIILSCDRLTYNLVQNRVENIELVFNEYSGIRVPRKAIRFKDGVKGVYVAVGENIEFKKLDVLYEGNDYIISRNIADSQYVMLYDQILLEEVELDERSDTIT